MTYRYADGTSGHSGSEASEERVRYLDDHGLTGNYQQRTVSLLRLLAGTGITQAELQRRLNVGHGTASQVLSTLHQAGRVERLAFKRDRSHVYVLPEYVGTLPTSPYRRLQSRQALRERIASLEDALATALHEGHLPNALREALTAVLDDRLTEPRKDQP